MARQAADAGRYVPGDRRWADQDSVSSLVRKYFIQDARRLARFRDRVQSVDTLGNAMQAGQREAGRERIFLPARVSYGNGAISTACTVVQLSATGAKLIVPETFSLPETFSVSVPQRDIDCRAQIIWRDGNKIGAAFIVEDSAAEPTREDYAAKIRALEVLNSKFKAQIAALTTQVRRLTEEV